jgi:hypothetical protein
VIQQTQSQPAQDGGSPGTDLRNDSLSVDRTALAVENHSKTVFESILFPRIVTVGCHHRVRSAAVILNLAIYPDAEID